MNQARIAIPSTLPGGLEAEVGGEALHRCRGELRVDLQADDREEAAATELLASNPATARLLILLFGSSETLTRDLQMHPELLDLLDLPDLLDPLVLLVQLDLLVQREQLVQPSLRLGVHARPLFASTLRRRVRRDSTDLAVGVGTVRPTPLSLLSLLVRLRH